MLTWDVGAHLQIWTRGGQVGDADGSPLDDVEFQVDGENDSTLVSPGVEHILDPGAGSRSRVEDESYVKSNLQAAVWIALDEGV